jgi:hypothetical protein
MRKTLAALLFVPAMAQAEFVSGNDLLSRMKSDVMEQMYALGYVIGVADSAENITVCSPDNIKAGQVYDIIKNFLEANPAIRHHSADIIIKSRLEVIWPCKQQGRGRGT